MRHRADEEQSSLLVLGPTYREPPRPSETISHARAVVSNHEWQRATIRNIENLDKRRTAS